MALMAATLAAAPVHKSPMAGQWFPQEKAALEKALEESFRAAEKRSGALPPRKRMLALIAPHAGIQYSGVVAASGYRLLNGPRNVILLGFSHRRPLEGVVIPDVEGYETPLGQVAVNRKIAAELGFPRRTEAELCDHSLENQLPFLQRAAPAATLVPLYVGELGPAELAAASRALAARLAAGDFIVASSDFTHHGETYKYTPFPNDSNLPRKLLQRAMQAFENIGTLEVEEFDRFLAATGDTICGRQPIRLLMAALARLKEDTYLSPIDYMASGDLTRDWSLSVGYGALGFYPASAFQVGDEDRRKLLRSARQTLERYLGGARERAPVPSAERGPELEQRTGVFVTVRKKGELRGCIGTLSAGAPLWDLVADRTLAATTADPRFPPLAREEGPVALEVSLLTPLKRIRDWRRFRLGQGAVLLLGEKSGLLLPQVAREFGWNQEQFLENLSRKAGLDAKAYRQPNATLYVYGAQVFGEPGSQPRAVTGVDH